MTHIEIIQQMLNFSMQQHLVKDAEITDLKNQLEAGKVPAQCVKPKETKNDRVS